MADDVLLNKAAVIERCAVSIITQHLDEFLHYSAAILQRDAQAG